MFAATILFLTPLQLLMFGPNNIATNVRYLPQPYYVYNYHIMFPINIRCRVKFRRSKYNQT